MPLTRSPSRALELSTRAHADHIAGQRADTPAEIRIDISPDTEHERLLSAESLDKVLKQRADGMWMLPSTRQRVQAAIDELEGVAPDPMALAKALLSPRFLPPLIALHQLKVLDLREYMNRLDRQNAIDHLTDFVPDLPELETWGWQVDLPHCLKALARAGISAEGHPASARPPLARALCRTDADAWVAALLQAGADPLRRMLDDADCGGGKISCLGLAVRRGHDKAVGMIIDTLLPAGRALGKKAYGALIKEAIESDCHELFNRLERDHDAAFPGILARGLYKHGRQIGPRLAAHLAQTYARNRAELELHGNVLRSVQAILSGVAEQESRLESRNRTLIAALSRLIETDQPARAREIRSALHRASTSRDEYAALASTCQRALDALAPHASFDLKRFGNDLRRFENLWADRDIEPSVAASAGREVTDTLLCHADQARQALHEGLKQFWGETAWQTLIRPRPMWGHGAVESADAALLRSCRETLTAAGKARQASDKLRVELEQHRPATSAPEHSAHIRHLFNVLLDTALEKSCAKAAKALLGDTPQANLRHGLGIADPQAVLIKIGALAAGQRAQVLPSVCQHIRQDPHSPLDAAMLLEQIGTLLPRLHDENGVFSQRSGASVAGALSLIGLSGSLYWLITRAKDLVTLDDYMGDYAPMVEDYFASGHIADKARWDELSEKFQDRFGFKYINGERGLAWFREPLKAQVMTATALTAGLALTGAGAAGLLAAVHLKIRDVARRRVEYREELLQHLSPTEA